MEAFLSKSTYLHSDFGKDLLWVGQGTSYKRPRLLVRTFKDGRFQWADFLDYGFFRVARQHGGAASAAKEQAKLMKSLSGVGSLGGSECTLGTCLSKKKFNDKNYQRAARKVPVMWPLETNVSVELDFATVICPYCLLIEPDQGHVCEKLVFANNMAWNFGATTAAVEAQRAGESIIEQAGQYKQAVMNSIENLRLCPAVEAQAAIEKAKMEEAATSSKANKQQPAINSKAKRQKKSQTAKELKFDFPAPKDKNTEDSEVTASKAAIPAVETRE